MFNMNNILNSDITWYLNQHSLTIYRHEVVIPTINELISPNNNLKTRTQPVENTTYYTLINANGKTVVRTTGPKLYQYLTTEIKRSRKSGHIEQLSLF